MRKALLVILMTASVLLVGCTPADTGGSSIPQNSGSSSSESSSTEQVFATITYQWNNYGDVTYGIENFPEAMTKGLEIPTRYVEGETLALPKLNMWKKNSKLVYEFEGWYLDEALQNKLVGETLPATLTGNVTLYAKIVAYVG